MGETQGAGRGVGEPELNVIFSGIKCSGGEAPSTTFHSLVDKDVTIGVWRDGDPEMPTPHRNPGLGAQCVLLPQTLAERRAE